MTGNTSSISWGVILLTRAPRFGSKEIKPSRANTFRASRSGVREIPNRSQSAFSGIRLSTSNTPSNISSRNLAATSSCNVVCPFEIIKSETLSFEFKFSIISPYTRAKASSRTRTT